VVVVGGLGTREWLPVVHYLSFPFIIYFRLIVLSAGPGRAGLERRS